MSFITCSLAASHPRGCEEVVVSWYGWSGPSPVIVSAGASVVEFAPVADAAFCFASTSAGSSGSVVGASDCRDVDEGGAKLGGIGSCSDGGGASCCAPREEFASCIMSLYHTHAPLIEEFNYGNEWKAGQTIDVISSLTSHQGSDPQPAAARSVPDPDRTVDLESLQNTLRSLL